jgi:hypothetical protein
MMCSGLELIHLFYQLALPFLDGTYAWFDQYLRPPQTFGMSRYDFLQGVTPHCRSLPFAFTVHLPVPLQSPRSPGPKVADMLGNQQN